MEKTPFSGDFQTKTTGFGYFQQIWAPAVPKNLVSGTGNVHRI